MIPYIMYDILKTSVFFRKLGEGAQLYFWGEGARMALIWLWLYYNVFELDSLRILFIRIMIDGIKQTTNSPDKNSMQSIGLLETRKHNADSANHFVTCLLDPSLSSSHEKATVALYCILDESAPA